MACISPITIKLQTGHQQVPCSKCAFCLTAQRQAWSFRLNIELKHSESSKFITLTYDEDNVPLNNKTPNLCKRDIQLFLKRLRKAAIQDTKEHLKLKTMSLAARYTPQIRYYIIGEYGPETYRPHYHGIFFNIPEITEKNITKHWKKGTTDVTIVTPQRINYVTKYLITRHNSPMYLQKPFSLMSKNPAIGHQYLKDNKIYHLKNDLLTVRNNNGTIQPIPRYYKDKIFQYKFNLKQIQEKNRTHQRATQETEYVKRLKLGYNPDAYKIEQTEQAIRRIEKNSNKNNNLKL